MLIPIKENKLQINRICWTIQTSNKGLSGGGEKRDKATGSLSGSCLQKQLVFLVGNKEIKDGTQNIQLVSL